MLVFELSSYERRYYLGLLFVEARIVENKDIDIFHFNVPEENEKFVLVEPIDIDGGHPKVSVKKRERIKSIEGFSL